MTKQEAMATNGQVINNSEIDDEDWRKISIKSKAISCVRNITVEPLLGIFQLSVVLTNLTTQNLNLQKACRVNLNLGDVVCSALEKQNATLYKQEEVDVQQLVTGMLIWQNVIQNTIPCMLIMFIGPWSDRNRKRKPFMLMPIFGELARNVGLIACVYYFYEWPMEIAGLVESIPSSITGSMPVLFLAVFAYVGDISTVKSRTLRVGYVSLFSSISVPIGASLSGVLFRDYGFYGIYYIATALYVFCLVYGIIVIRDVKPDNVDKTEDIEYADCKKSSMCKIADFFDLKHVKQAFRVTFKEGSDDRKTNIILLLIIVIILMGPLSGEQSFMYLLTRVKYNWNEVDYSIFSAYYFICNLLGIGLTLALLVKQFKMDDRLIGALGCLSKGLAAFVYAFAPTGYVFYIGPIVDIFHGTAFVAMRSMLSKLVPANELGQVLAVFSLIETAVPAIFKPLYSVIYQYTVNWLPGAFYVFGGIVNIPGVLIFLWMYYNVHQKENKIGPSNCETPKLQN